MKKRQIFIVAGVVVLAGAIFLAMQLSSSGKNQPGSDISPMRSDTTGVLVEAIQVNNDSIQTYINLTGRLQPQEKIDIYAEVNGILEGTGKPFKEGVYFRQGEILININDDEARNNLIAQRSSFINAVAQVVPDLKIDFPDIYPIYKDYLLGLQADEPLPPLPPVNNARQKLFLTGRNIYSQFYNIQQLQSRLQKYVIRAPFNGTVTEVNINEGTLVRNTQKLGEFVKTGIYEMEAAVGVNEVEFIEVGDQVALKPTQTDKNYLGRVIRINEKVDQQTQTIKVFIQVNGSDLRTGMYMAGEVAAQQYPSAIEIPRESLINQNQVFVMHDSTAQLRQVDVLKFSEEEVIVEGLENGDWVIEEGRTAAFEGTRISIAQN